MKKGTALVPTFLAFAVTKLLEEHYGKLVDYGFTASMEDDLDKIAAGEEQRVDWLTRFYKGENGEPGLHAMVTEHLDEIDARAVNSIELPAATSSCASAATGRTSSAATTRASLPEDIVPDELTPERAEELLAAPGDARVLGAAPRDGAAGRGAQRPLRAVRHRGAARGLGGEAAHGVALLDDDRRRRSRSTTRSGCCRCRGWSASPTARRCWRMNGRYGPFIKTGNGDPLARERGADLLDRPRPGARAARRAEDRAGAAARRSRRCASWAQTPRPGVQSWSRTADLVHT